MLTPLLYLGAFLSGIRPASWYGTRLLPFISAAVLLAITADADWGWSIVLPIAALLYGILASTVCYAAKVRDYA